MHRTFWKRFGNLRTLLYLLIEALVCLVIWALSRIFEDAFVRWAKALYGQYGTKHVAICLRWYADNPVAGIIVACALTMIVLWCVAFIDDRMLKRRDATARVPQRAPGVLLGDIFRKRNREQLTDEQLRLDVEERKERLKQLRAGGFTESCDEWGRGSAKEQYDNLKLQAEGPELAQKIITGHVNTISKSESEASETDVSLSLRFNDDQRYVFAFENFGTDPAFSAFGIVVLGESRRIEFKAEREVIKGRPEPMFAYMVAEDGKREMLRSYELIGAILSSEMEDAKARDDKKRYVFAATRTGEAEFHVTTSFVDRNRILRRRERSHRLILKRSETRPENAIRFELSPLEAT